MLGGDVQLEGRGDYLFVTHGRSAHSVEELEEVIEAIESGLTGEGTRRLLFDSRGADRTSDEVQERLWTWLESAGLERVATLVTSDMLSISLKMTGLARGVKLRAFDDEREADQWLREA